MRNEANIGRAPKKGYQTPRLTNHGDVRAITLHLDCREDRHDSCHEGGCASHLLDHRHDRC